MPPITIFCPFTRADYVQRWFDDLASTDLDPKKVNLALLIDVGREEGGQDIYLKIMDEMNRTAYRKFVITRNEHHVNEVNIPVRRKRIAEIHNQSKDVIRALDGQVVLGLEDDTVFTNLCVKRLFEPLLIDGVGMITAYEAGRWHSKMLGIWQFDNVQEPTECWTCLPGENYESIDAAGMYCYMTPTELYLAHEYNSETWQPWGPDVNYGLWLRQQGYENFVDWTQPCGHRDGDLVITPNSDLYVEHFYKTDEPFWNRGKP